MHIDIIKLKLYNIVKTTGTDIDKILPAVSRFGAGNRKEKKETVIEKLKAFFERFWNIGLCHL